MDFTKESYRILKDYPYMERGIERAQIEIDRLKEKEDHLRSRLELAAESDDDGRIQRDITNALCMISELQRSREQTRRWLDHIEDTLQQLPDLDRELLFRLYIDNDDSRGIDKFCSDTGTDKGKAYRMRDAALRRFTMLYYGVLNTY